MTDKEANVSVWERPALRGVDPEAFVQVGVDRFYRGICEIDVITTPVGAYPYLSEFRTSRDRRLVGFISGYHPLGHLGKAASSHYLLREVDDEATVQVIKREVKLEVSSRMKKAEKKKKSKKSKKSKKA
jgi:hypothetical protein